MLQKNKGVRMKKVWMRLSSFLLSLSLIFSIILFEKSNITAEVGDFPDSYRTALAALQEKYPAWKFVPIVIDTPWPKVLSEQSKLGQNLIHMSVNDAWKSTADRAYSWTSNSYTPYDSNAWVNASPDIIAYYMDPRNFINEKSIFQFLALSFDAGTESITGVEKILAGSFMDKKTIYRPDGSALTYAELFMEAAKESGASAYHLASRVIQEVGRGGSTSTTGTNLGLEGIYNFFNIGAVSSSNAAITGLNYAKANDPATGRPWDSPYKSIVNGAKFIAKSYIAIGQDTLYFQKFDVKSGGFWHQYMTNIQAVASEGIRLADTYAGLSMTDSPLTFYIPVYKDMPEAPSPRPAENGNPNNWLSALDVNGHTLTPSFSPSVTEGYTIIVPNNLTQVHINAVAVAPTSQISGAGDVALQIGDNQVAVTVTAQNGQTRVYKVNIVRSGTENEYFTSDFRVDESGWIKGVSPEMTVASFRDGFSMRNGTVLQIMDGAGNIMSDESAFVGTGAGVRFSNAAGEEVAKFTVILAGDANGDGRITSTDLTLVCRHVLKQTELQGAMLLASDVNGDGRVTSTDLTLICRHVLKQSVLLQ